MLATIETTLSERLLLARLRAGFRTVADAADHPSFTFSRQTLGLWEKHPGGMPPARALLELAMIYRTSPGWIRAGVDGP